MSFGRKIIRKTGELFSLSPSEGRGVLVLLPLLAAAGLMIHGLGKPKSDARFLNQADSLIRTQVPINPEESGPGDLFYFDPNTVTLEQLCALGFELRTAASIVKYRDGGKVFEVAEDLAMCYGVTLEQYLAVEPYIVIDKAFHRKHRPVIGSARYPDHNINEVREITVRELFDPDSLDEQGYKALGFTAAQARTIINYRQSVGGFTSPEQFGRCYAISEDALEKLKPFMIFERPEMLPQAEETLDNSPPAVLFPVEINGADSTTLRAVSGIGEVMVVRIMEYRDRLGGFHTVEQLAELKGMTQANYERIIQQITVDTCKISKIDINFALPKELVARLEKHPYATPRMTGKLLSARQLKGGYTNTQELVEEKIMTKEEAARLAPYLLFKPLERD